MDITKHNWHEAVSVVEAAIRECDFMAIDAEMTGLPAHLQNPLHGTSPGASQTLEAKFREWRKAVTKLLMVQFGLTTFHWHPERKAYLAKPFNFYVFPSDDNAPFLSSPSSMRFLASRGFDFNRLFVEGLDTPHIHTVAQWMAAAKKPIVGHNAFLDVMYLMKALYHPLPDKMENYRQLLHLSFPLIIDTKYFAVASSSISCLLPGGGPPSPHMMPMLSSSPPGGAGGNLQSTPSTSLGDLCHLVGSLPRVCANVITNAPTSSELTTGDKVDDVDIDFAPGYESYRHRQRYHEAGYDAFMAGVVYARLAHYELSASPAATAGGPVGTAEAVSAYVNRLWWGRKTLFFACEPREETLTRIITMVRADGANAEWVAAQLLAVSTPATLDALAKAICARAAAPTGPPPAAAAALSTALVRNCPSFQPFLLQRCRETAMVASTATAPNATVSAHAMRSGGGWGHNGFNGNHNNYNGNGVYYNAHGAPMRAPAPQGMWGPTMPAAGPVGATMMSPPSTPGAPRRGNHPGNWGMPTSPGGQHFGYGNPNVSNSGNVDAKQFSEFIAKVWPRPAPAPAAGPVASGPHVLAPGAEPATTVAAAATTAAIASATVVPAAS